MVDVFILIMGTENTVSFFGHLFGFVQLFFSFGYILWPPFCGYFSHFVHTRLRCSCFVLRVRVCVYTQQQLTTCAHNMRNVSTQLRASLQADARHRR